MSSFAVATKFNHKLLTSTICNRTILIPSFYSILNIQLPKPRKLRKKSTSVISTQEKQSIVIALGGNALLKRGEPLTIDVQRKNIKHGLNKLRDILNDNNIILVHGNGPQG